MKYNLLFSVASLEGAVIAKFSFLEDAAAFVGFRGESFQIRYRNSAVWREGEEEISASESYDKCAEICRKRMDEICRGTRRVR
jgi:hypothetical protein